MLGLHTRNGWRAVFAIAAAGALVAVGSSMAVAAPTTKAEAQGVNATGQLVEPLLDTGDCITTKPVAYPGTGPKCGSGLELGDPGFTFAQAVQGSATDPNSLQGSPWAQNTTINPILQGTAYSRGYASTGPLDITGLGEVSLTEIFDGLAAADVSDILTPVLNGLGQIGQTLAPVIAPLSDGVQTALDGVNGVLPVAVATGVVESQCQATGSPLRARAASTVADVNLVVGEGVLANGVFVPLTGPNGADTPPNTNLLIGAPQDLVDAVLDTLQDSLNTSLDGAGAPLNLLLDPVQDQVVDAILEQLEPTLLTALADGLQPLIEGTVNKQTPNPTQVSGATGTNSTGSVEVIALELILFDAAGPQGSQTVQLSRSECGPNAADDGTPTPPVDEDDDGDGDDGDGDDSDDSDDGDGDDDGDDDEPRVVDSGINDGGNLGALAITGLLAASTLVGSAARQRLLLDQ